MKKKIRKNYSGAVPNGKVLNSRNNSLQDTYSSDYLNRTIDGLTKLKVSPSEPTTGEEVWLQKGKNLIDKGYLRTGVYKLGDGTYVDGADSCCTKNFIEINNSKNYVLSWSSPSNSQLVYVLYYDENKNYLGNSSTQFSNGSLTLNNYVNYSDAKYVNLRFDATLSSLTNLQLEQSEIATPYEPFTRKIHTKNDNGVYEEFYNETNREIYSLAEQKIGTWIDGKPLYRKVVDFGYLPNATTKLVSTGASNVDIVTNLRGIGISNYGSLSIPLADTSALTNQVALWYDKTTNQIQIKSGVDRSSFYGYVTIEYTKTTD